MVTLRRKTTSTSSTTKGAAKVCQPPTGFGGTVTIELQIIWLQESGVGGMIGVVFEG